jgi:hypothetical protein
MINDEARMPNNSAVSITLSDFVIYKMSRFAPDRRIHST